MRTGDTLTDLARELMLKHPQLTSSRAYAMAMEHNPDLARRWHLGEASEAPGEPGEGVEPSTTDPGPLLLSTIASKVAAGMDREAATVATFKALPTLAAYYHAGRLIPRQARRERIRRLAPGEPLIGGRTYVHKLAGPEVGGGMFEVL